MSKYVFGVDLGGTTAKVGLFTEDGERVDLWEVVTNTDDGGSHILPTIAEAVKAKMEEKGLAREEILGVGIGVPGPVDADSVVHGAVNLGWGIFDLKKTMEELTGGLLCVAGNDANVAALGEAWKGAAAGCGNVVMATLGTGLGGGLITDGRLLAGGIGGAGEIGHIHVEDNETEACGCGNYGCFEEYASATGAVRIARRTLAASDEPSCLRELGDALTCKDIFDAAKSGDAVANKIVERYGYYLGKGLAVVATTINPEVIVLGGGVSRAGQIILDCLKDSFNKYCFKPNRDVKFVLATLGNDAGMFGAIKLVLDAAK